MFSIITSIATLTFIFLCVSLLIFSFFAYIHYSHEQEINFPGNKLLMVSIVMSVFFSILIFIIVCFDILNEGCTYDKFSIDIDFDMRTIWRTALFFSVFFFLLNIFWLRYYNYDNPHREDKTDIEQSVRIKTSLVHLVKYGVGIFLTVVFLSFVYGGKVRMNFDAQVYLPDTLIFSDLRRDTHSMIINRTTYITRVIPKWHVILTSPFIFYGSFLLFIVGGFGMATVPVSFITFWFKRPSKPNAENMVISDMIILKETQKNIEQLKDLIEAQSELEELRQSENVDKEVIRTKIENHNIEVIQCQEQLINLEDLMSSRKRKNNILDENPLKYLFFLLFGLFSGLVSIVIVAHSTLSFIGVNSVLEAPLFFLYNLNIFYPLLFFMFITLYMLFCTIKGYEKLSEIFPHKFGHNQMKTNRTWMDTFLIIANLSIPTSWAIVGFFLKFSSNFFAFTHVNKFLKLYVLNVTYIKVFFSYGVFNAVFLFSFMLGIVITCSTSITTEELDRRIEDTKEHLKFNQFQFQKTKRVA